MRPDTTVGDDPRYLEHLARLMEKQAGKSENRSDFFKIHAARLREISYKLKQLESCVLKGLTAHLRELERKANGRRQN